MSKTTVSCGDQRAFSHNFISKELSVTKDINGISRTVFTHVSSLHGLLNDWIRLQGNGTKLCKAMAALKLHECTDSYYPQSLKPLTENLVDILDGLLHVVEGIQIIDKKMKALAQLQPTKESVILTWSALKISETVSTIYNALQKEYQIKKVVTENIAHCRDENLIEIYVSSWEFDVYLDLEYNTSYLFVEVGLPSIT